MTRGPAAALVLALAALPGTAPAQGLIDHGSGPVTIEADNGIEWRRDEHVYIANGNAVATRGNVTVHAKRLIAHYRERAAPAAAAPEGAEAGPKPPGTDKGRNAGKDADKDTGKAKPEGEKQQQGVASDIYRVDAEGDVVITTPTQTAVGDRGVYDVDRAMMVLTGGHLRLTTALDTVTARDSLEYWEQRQLAIARGDAVATRTDRRVSADTLVAHIVEDPKTKQSRASKVDAFGNARVSTPGQIATGAKGVYDLDTNLANLAGNVHVTQGNNQLEGEYADVNMNTGVSRMLSGPAAGRAGQRVRGLFVPEHGPANGQPAPAARPGS